MVYIKSEIPVVYILGIPVHKLQMSELLDLCEEAIRQRVQLLLGVVNVAKLVNSRKNMQLRKSIETADIILADGLGVVWLSKLMGQPLPERVAGIDIMSGLLKRANLEHYRVYFLGARKEVVEKVVEHVQKNYPGLLVAGFHDG